ncbi:MAG: acetyl-CoA decarbonylase/synthase complex subunit gamma [Candidatus Omnitrophica bacterium]|nr:acetyl-CoA decarbonylase/synthase complex subunit gamma [Candidatus Omnitrophota bacterium]
MALSGLDIYKLLPKTNCKECGFATCLAFAMQLAKKSANLDKCPYLSAESKIALEASALPPIKLIIIGSGDNKLETGNETVMFRHEEKFRNPAGIGFLIEDSLSDGAIKSKLEQINKLKFERVGQELNVNLIALRQNSDKARFAAAVETVSGNTHLGLVLMSADEDALREALKICAQGKPLIYGADKDNVQELGKLALEYSVPIAALADSLDGLSFLTQELNKLGVKDIVLDTGAKPLSKKIEDLTFIRRLALKKQERSLGYPSIVVVENDDPYEEAQDAATYIARYAGIVIIKDPAPHQVLSLLTLRQNIYTDPQKPLQIEPKLYSVGQAGKDSPLMVTTNFSLTYFTVLGEVEASKVPSYILSVDTEGMSVLTAWAAEKFTPDKISESLGKFGVREAVRHNRLIIPGYVAMMSADLEEKCGFQVIVGPKEASGLPSFLKNL